MDLFWVGLNSLLRLNDEAQVFDRGGLKLAFLLIELKSRVGQYANDEFDSLSVLLARAVRVNYYIVKVSRATDTKSL